jgi:hypothetical protein
VSSLQAVARTLAVNAVTAEVVGALSDNGCRSILLKGPALARALYDGPGEHRPYFDSDLLVRPQDLARAGEVLTRLGFTLVLDHSEHASVSEPHAQEWAREGAGAIDLHWRVAGGGDRSWEVLTRWVEPIAIGRVTVEAVHGPAVALIVALHAAHHGTTATKPLEDLARALERLDAATWQAALELSSELDATEAFSAGLRLVPSGVELADRLGTSAVVSAHRRLMASSQPPGSLGLLRIAQTRGPLGRVRAACATLFPAPSFMRTSYPSARRGRRGLLLAYAARLGARARQLPAAVRALRAARRG